jgi:hypothetical protein
MSEQLKNKVIALKTIASERANYYQRLAFDNLAKEFTAFAEIFDEMLNYIENNEARQSVNTAEIQSEEEVTETRAEGEKNDT